MTMIADNLQAVHARVAAACVAASRPVNSVTLLAVSKTFSIHAIEEAIAAGQHCLGENYIQEAVEKIRVLGHATAQWHCIGPVQSNKTRLVAEHFDWVQSVDRLKIAQRLSEQRPRIWRRCKYASRSTLTAAPTRPVSRPPNLLLWRMRSHSCHGSSCADS